MSISSNFYKLLAPFVPWPIYIAQYLYRWVLKCCYFGLIYCSCCMAVHHQLLNTTHTCCRLLVTIRNTKYPICLYIFTHHVPIKLAQPCSNRRTSNPRLFSFLCSPNIHLAKWCLDEGHRRRAERMLCLQIALEWGGVIGNRTISAWLINW